MAMEMTTRGIEKQIAKLKSDQRIERIGGKKDGNWIVKECFQNKIKVLLLATEIK